MSYFIANQISFSKDFKTFKVKGGDNNLIPRSNNWTNDIPIEELYYNVNGGMLQFRNATNEKICLVDHLVSTFHFEGNWEQETDFFHEHRNKDQRAKDFNDGFIATLKKILKEDYSTKKEYIISLKERNSFIMKRNPTFLYLTRYANQAQKFSYYVALNLANKYSNVSPKIINLSEVETPELTEL